MKIITPRVVNRKSHGLEPLEVLLPVIISKRFQFLLLISLGFTNLKGQSMYVRQKNGIENSYSLNNIAKIDFSSENLNVTDKTLGMGIYALSSIRYVNFQNIISNSSSKFNQSDHTISLYPNPVIDQLNLLFNEKDISDLKNISILNSEGLQVYYCSDIKENFIDISSFPKGLYLCLVTTEKYIKTIKFIKD